MFFGLTNSPATFQMMMNAIFQEEIHEGWLIVYMDCHRRLDSIEIQGSVVVREQQRYNVEPDPEYEGCYKSQGYDDVSELDHDVGREVVDFEGHKRAVRVPTLVQVLKETKSAPSTKEVELNPHL